MNDRRRGRPPLPPEVQRQRLLDAARRALAEADFGSMRVTDVVRAAGMSTRSFYDHFGSKEELLIGLIDEAGQKLVAEFAAIFAPNEVDPVDKVDRALAAYLAAFAATPLNPEKLGEGATVRVQASLRHYLQEVGVHIAGELARLHETGQIVHPPDPLVVEVLLVGLLGVASRYVAEGRNAELAELREPLRDFLIRIWV